MPPAPVPPAQQPINCVTNDNDQIAVRGVVTDRNGAAAPLGSGIYGETKARDGCGVFGTATGGKGVGVQGNGPTVGVSGFSDGGIAVRGLSHNIALFAQGGNRAARFVGVVEVNNIDLEATLAEMERRIQAAEIRDLTQHLGPVIKRI